MLEKTPFTPRNPPSNPKIDPFVPKFIYKDPNVQDDIEIKEEFFGSRRKLRFGILGAGISTLNFLHFLEEKIPRQSVEVVVYEKNWDVGGVWLTTHYPGVRCDLPGYSYQFSWRGHEWKEFLPGAEETLAYLQTVAKEQDFYRYMRFRKEIVKASWTDEEAKWRLSVRDMETGKIEEETFDLFLELNGPVSNPQITIDGINDFKGEVVHTGYWKEGIDLKGKKVALLGYGSSGVQIAPSILPGVSKLYTWFRHRTYVVPPGWPDWAAEGGANFKYTEEQRALLKDPDVNAAYRKTMDEWLVGRWANNINGSEGSKQGRKALTQFMQEKLKSKPGLYEKIVPEDFDPGCRRAVFSHGYLEALVDPKTTVLFGEPKRFTPSGFLDDEGNERPIDVVIAATGYDQSHHPRFPKLINGVPIEDIWKQTPLFRSSPPAYMSTMMASMPNYFHSSSAYSHVYGSWFQTSEATVKYMVACIQKMQIDHITTITVKDKAVQHFLKHANTFLQRMVQSGPCVAWYKTEDGRPATWPGNKAHYRKALSEPRFEDFDIRYEDEEDMFSYLGNGFVEEVDGVEGADITDYIEPPSREVKKEELEKLKGIYAVAIPGPNVREQQEKGQARL